MDVSFYNYKVFVMNTKGKLVILAIYDIMRDPDNKYNETESESLPDGRILVTKNGKFGIIDTNTKKPIYPLKIRIYRLFFEFI